MGRLNRRTFLRGAGGVALSLPFLEAMSEGSSVVADDRDGLVDGRIRRFVIVFKGNGVHQRSFFPEPGGSFAGTNLAPVAEFQDRSLVLDGVRLKSALDSEGEMHQTGMGSVLSGTRLQNTGVHVGGGGATSGWGNGVSVDQVIASRIRGTTRFASLELGVKANVIGSEVRTRMVYRGPADPISPIDSPRMVFDRLFAGIGEDTAVREAMFDERRRVVDAVQDQFDHVRARVGRSDRLRLDRHLSFIDELETRIGDGNNMCTPGTRPAALDGGYEDVPDISRAQIDNLVAAFACDLTRVATLQYSTGAYHMRCPWLGDNDTGHTLGHATTGGHNGIIDPSDSVATSSTQKWNRRSEWYMEEVAHLLRRLEETPDGEGNLLDSTAVLFVSENSNPHHYLTRMPFVLFGNAGGRFQSGIQRYADPGDQRAMANHNRLLIALQQGYGVESDTIGEPEYCEGGALDGVLA